MHGFENLEPLWRHSQRLQSGYSCEGDKHSSQHNEEKNDVPQQDEHDSFDWSPKLLSESRLWGRLHDCEGLYADTCSSGSPPSSFRFQDSMSIRRLSGLKIGCGFAAAPGYGIDSPRILYCFRSLEMMSNSRLCSLSLPARCPRRTIRPFLISYGNELPGTR